MPVQELLPNIKRYFHDILGVEVSITPWQDEGRVPLFLRDRYQFLITELINQHCLFLVDTCEQEETPVTIRKHIEQLRGKWAAPVIYVRERITSYNRKRLIEHKVPFVVPGNQMYLPMLGLDLREHFKKPHPEGTHALRPASQVVLIHALLREEAELSPTILADKLGYSIMTMSRVLDELEAVDLGESASVGRERHLHFLAPRHEIWEKAQPLLRNPVTKHHLIRCPPGAKPSVCRCGLDALAHYSMLAEPKGMSFALGREDWKVFRQNAQAEVAMGDEPEAMTIELWSYAPALLADDGWVDRLSLYLSLRDTEDERVQAALDQMIKEIPW